MKEIAITTTVHIIGQKKGIADILNRVLTGFPEKISVTENDHIEIFNQKIKKANDLLAEYNTSYTLMDFLDDANRMKSPCKDYVLSYIDDDEPDGSENYGINLIKAEEKDSQCSLILQTCVLESQGSYISQDWDDWSRRMVRLYGVKVILSQEFSDD